MHHKESIKKLFEDNSTIKNPLTPKKILEKLQEENTRVGAMKNIIVRAQGGEDMDPFFNDIVKIIDTRNVKLKRLTNWYLKKYTKGKTIRQLLCVNTFLKDLSDKSSSIRKACLETIGFMGDEVVLSNYLNKLKKMDGDKEVLIELINSLARFPQILFPSDMIKGFIYSNDPTLITQALACISTNDFSCLEDEELLDLFKRTELESLSFVMKMMYSRRKTIQIDINTLLVALRIDSLPLFYFTASLLLYIDSNYKQLVYDISLLYMKSSPEALYHLLLFQETLLNSVRYSNSKYLLYENDPLFIKKQKIKILFLKLDNISIGEIKRCREEALAMTILKYSLKRNIVVQDLLNSNLDLIDLLFESFPFSTTFTYLISQYLLNLNISSFPISKIRKYLFLSANCCSKIPNSLESIEKKPLLGFDILKFYVILFKRKVLTEEKLKEHIKRLKKIDFMAEKARFVLDLINKGDTKTLISFVENSVKENIDKTEIKLYLGKDSRIVEDRPEENNILSCKPYRETTHSQPLDFQLPPSFGFQVPERNEWLTSPSSGDVLVDTRYLKGTLSLVKDSISLEIDVLEGPQKIYYGVEKNRKEKLLEREETIQLEVVDLSKINKTFKLIVSNKVFEIYLDYKRFTSPLKCTEEKLEQSFKTLTNYKMVFKLPEEFKFNESSYAFRILSHEIYGKSLCGQVVLKGEREVLDLI